MSPPSKVAERLAAAMAKRRLVQITRSPRNANPLDGFVLAVGSKWVLVATTGDGGYFDGFVAVRLKEVVKVRKDQSFEGRFARTQPEWPPTAPADIDLDTTSGLVRDLNHVAPLIGIEQERRHNSAASWIGFVVGVRNGRLGLHEVGPDATWHEHPYAYRLRRITKVTVLNRYQTALSAIAGPGPRP